MIETYQYGLQPPTGGADVVHRQMRAAHNYRNVLTEIERGRRAAIRLLDEPIRPLEAAAREADVLCASLATAIKTERAVTRTRSEGDPDRKALKVASDARKEARRQLGEARKALREGGSLKAAQTRVNDMANVLKKNARRHCGVYWGTYLLIEDAAEQAFGDLPLYDNELPNDPRFSRWNDGDGARVGAQVHSFEIIGS